MLDSSKPDHGSPEWLVQQMWGVLQEIDKFGLGFATKRHYKKNVRKDQGIRGGKRHGFLF